MNLISWFDKGLKNTNNSYKKTLTKCFYDLSNNTVFNIRVSGGDIFQFVV